MNENFHHTRTPFLILVNGESKIIFFWLLTDDGEGFFVVKIFGRLQSEKIWQKWSLSIIRLSPGVGKEESFVN